MSDIDTAAVRQAGWMRKEYFHIAYPVVHDLCDALDARDGDLRLTQQMATQMQMHLDGAKAALDAERADHDVTRRRLVSEMEARGEAESRLAAVIALCADTKRETGSTLLTIAEVRAAATGGDQ